MISKCPECGRSYPTHHGKICKLCAAKTSTVTANSTAAAHAVTDVKVKAPEAFVAASAASPPEKKDVPVVSAGTAPKTTAPLQDFGFNPYSGGISEVKAKPEGVVLEGDSSPRACPYCEFENDPTDVFCRSCEKMIIKSSDGNKLKEYSLTDLKGTIPDQIAKLKKIGITTTLQLLDKGSSPTKRKTLTIKTGISETFLMRLIHQTDLLRINSIQPEQTFILETIGINSLKMLERKSAKEIVDTMMKQRTMLQSKKIMVLPGEKVVSQWLDELKKLEKVVK